MSERYNLYGLKDYKKSRLFNNDTVISDDYFKVLMVGFSGGAPTRSIFIQAMFGFNSICSDITIRYEDDQEEANACGFISSKNECLINFLKFSKSKSNPFKDFPYFDYFTNKFYKKIVIYNYPFFFYDSSWILDWNEDDWSRIKNPKLANNTLKSIVTFFNDIRNNKIPAIKNAKDVIEYQGEGYPWQIKNGKISLSDDLGLTDKSQRDEWESVYYEDA